MEIIKIRNVTKEKIETENEIEIETTIETKSPKQGVRAEARRACIRYLMVKLLRECHEAGGQSHYLLGTLMILREGHFLFLPDKQT